MIYLNGNKIIPTIFPDKTSQVWKLEEGLILNRVNVVIWDFESESEFIQVAQVVDLVKNQEPNVHLILEIPYLPYARQDKEVSNSTTFAKYTFMKLLNTLEVDAIISYDVHSDIYNKLCYLVNKDPSFFIKEVLVDTKPTGICFPDKGAYNRYKDLNPIKNYLQVTLDKKRNQSSGEIEGLEYNEKYDVTGYKMLIVDDLCDGGRTFIEASKLLYSLGAEEVNLYTTHGIYSKGTKVLFDSGIKRIFNYKGEVLNDGSSYILL